MLTGVTIYTFDGFGFGASWAEILALEVRVDSGGGGGVVETVIRRQAKKLEDLAVQ